MPNLYSVPTLIAMLVFWLLGLYVLTRGPRSNVSRLAATGQLLIALYLLGQALRMNASSAAEAATWSQRFWFGGALAPAVWYWLTVVLTENTEEVTSTGKWPWIRRLIGVGFLIGGAFYAVASNINNLLFQWSQPGSSSSSSGFSFQPTDLYAGFVALTLAAALAALANLRHLWATSTDSRLRSRFGWLTASGSFFALGGGYLTLIIWLDLGADQTIGHVLLGLGLAFIAWNILQYNAFLEDQVLLRDFLYFITSMTLLGLLYAGVVVAVGIDDPFDRLVGLVLVVSLALVSHSLSEFARQVWDRVFYRNEAGDLRSILRALTAEAGLAPKINRVLSDSRTELAAIEEKQMRTEVEDALRRLNNLPALSAHPLQSSLQNLISHRLRLESADGQSEQDTSLSRSRALHQTLIETIDRLKPPGDRPKTLSVGWIQYLVLHEAYVLEHQNRQIMARYYIGEGTFNRNRRQALAAVARELLEQEETRQ